MSSSVGRIRGQSPPDTGEINKKNGWNVGIHVDVASGGFVAPFLYPDLEWDFRLPNVLSINASGHKCALWVLALLVPSDVFIGRSGSAHHRLVCWSLVACGHSTH